MCAHCLLRMLCILTVCNIVTTHASVNPEAELLNWLFSQERYNPQARPAPHPSQILTVNFGFSLGRIESLEEKTQILTTFGWLHMTWPDHFLKWDPVDHSDITRVVVERYYIWMPEVVLLNSVNEGNDISLDTQFRAVVHHTGLVKWVPGFRFETACRLDLTYFPFDVQTCHINITNWSFASDTVNFTTSTNGVNLFYYKSNAEWELAESCLGQTTLPKSDMSLDGEPTSAPLVHVTLIMRRRPVYYVINILVPCTVMTLASILVFVLPCDSGEKVSLAISVLLSYTVLMVMIAENMPKSSETVAVLAAFLTVNVVLTTVSLLLTVLTLNIHNRSPELPMPRVIRVVFLEGLARLMLMTPTPSTVPQIQKEKEALRATDSQRRHNCSESLADDVFVDTNKSGNSVRKTATGFSFLEPGGRVLHSGGASGESWRVEEPPFSNHWKRLGNVLDRFFLVVYATAVIAVCIAMLVSVRRRDIIHDAC